WPIFSASSPSTFAVTRMAMSRNRNCGTVMAPSTAAARAAKFIATLRPTGTRNKKQARHRWRRACYRAFRRSSAGLRHLACRQAARAHPHVHALTGGRHDTDPPQVRQPGARRLVIGVADVLAERLSLVANVA